MTESFDKNFYPRSQREPLVTFVAEISETKCKKGPSLDNVYTLRLVTDDQKVIDLAKLPPDVTVKVSISINEV